MASIQRADVRSRSQRPATAPPESPRSSPRPARRPQLAADVLQPRHGTRLRPGSRRRLHVRAGRSTILPASRGSVLEQRPLPDDEAIRKAIRASAKGRIIAWDPVQRKSVWTAEFPVPWNGGLLSTAGGLVFQGNGMGRFVAYDAANGKTLWDFHAQTGIVAAPVTYEVGGEQYVTILAGWGGAAPLFAGEIVTQAAKGGLNRILTFKLGGAATLPPLLTVKRPPNPPALTASKEALERGGGWYRGYWTGGHGPATVAGGVVTDLRFSAMLGSPEAHRAVVLDGVLMRNGMISFSDFLKPDDVEHDRPVGL